MKTRNAIAWGTILAGALAGASCTSISAERALSNEYTRSQDQRNGYEDREDGRLQKQDEERAFQEQLRRKS